MEGKTADRLWKVTVGSGSSAFLESHEGLFQGLRINDNEGGGGAACSTVGGLVGGGFRIELLAKFFYFRCDVCYWHGRCNAGVRCVVVIFVGSKLG